MPRLRLVPETPPIDATPRSLPLSPGIGSYWGAQGLSGGVPMLVGESAIRVYHWGPIEGWVNESLVGYIRQVRAGLEAA